METWPHGGCRARAGVEASCCRLGLASRPPCLTSLPGTWDCRGEDLKQRIPVESLSGGGGQQHEASPGTSCPRESKSLRAFPPNPPQAQATTCSLGTLATVGKGDMLGREGRGVFAQKPEA